MPAWTPKIRTLEDDIEREKARMELLEIERKFKREQVPATQWQPVTEQPITETAPFMETPAPSIEQSQAWLPQLMEDEAPEIEQPQYEIRPQPAITPPIKPVEVPVAKEKPTEVPFWQRGLQVFAAPFVWIDENVIKPSLSLLGTTAGFVPEVARLPGEDYWEWKKRSWAGWKSPGININVPWSDEPWRVDVRGIMELAPWLLIPGAGQVGTGARAARGVAGVLGKLGTAGRVLGTAVEYSPWGLAEKTAGIAIKGTFKTLGKVIGGAEAKIFGKIPAPTPPAPVVAKLTKFFDESVVPARVAFEKELPTLRARQFQAVEDIWARVRSGEITATEGTALSEKATAGGIKAGFAVEVRGIPEMKIEVNPSLVKEYGAIAMFDIRTKTLSFKSAEYMAQPLLLNHELAHAFVKGLPKVERVSLLEQYAKIMGDKKVTYGRYGTEEFLAQGYADYVTKSIPIEEMDKAIIEFYKKLPLDLTYLTKGIPKFTVDETEELLSMIVKSSENGLVTRDSALALRELLLKGGLPEPHHIRDFAKVYGTEFAQAVGKLKSLPRSGWEKIIDALNLPRAALASGDLSGTFRQGLFLVLTHPEKVPRAFWRQLKFFASEKLSLEMDDTLRNHPLYQKATQEWGVEFTPIRKGAQMVAKEEPFASNIAQYLPFVRRSERAFTGFLNEMRMGAVEAANNAMTAQGASAAEMKLMGKFINIASGRGKLPANLDQYAPVLNTLLFSAKYQMSTLQLPRQLGRMLLSKNPYMRREAAKALVTFVGGGAALLGLLKASGVTKKVELDPRSSDFGKIKIGETRLDIWRGYIQYARFAAQLLTGESKSAYGNMSKKERDQTAWRFLQSKSSPAFGLIVDLLRGEDYMGEPLFEKTTGAIKTARNRFLPIAIQDIVDAMEQSGTNGLWVAAPSILGVGVLTFVNDFVRVKEKIAREMGYQTWDEIDPKTQREIQNRNAELQTATIQFDRRVMGTAWGDWRLAGNAVEDVFRQNVDLAVAQYRTTGDGYTFREKISDAFTARRGGYDVREKEPRFEDIVKRLGAKDTLESLVGLGPEQLAIKIYNDALWGDDMYDEFGDYRFDEAEVRKQQLQQQLGDELFNYVEEYRGAKYETFPPEYQELVKAKIVMKPYWQVAKEIERIFGKFYAESNRGQAQISKLRKAKRLNPEIEKAYQKFYTRTT